MSPASKEKKNGKDKAEEETKGEKQPERPIGVAYGGDRMQARDPVTAEPVTVGREADVRDIKGIAAGASEDDQGNPIVVVAPVRVDGRNRRTDDDALEGAQCEIVKGDLKGTEGVFTQVQRYDPESGYPTQVIVRTDDDNYELVSVPYADIRPAKSLR